MKIVFMGTPDFAVSALEAIIAAGHEVVLVVTQPDKEKGRGKQVQKSDVKICAEKYNIPVFQPVKIKTPEAVAELKTYDADIFVVAAFGQILSKEILDMPKYGCVNIHASLLPKYRGAAPIQWSVINGDKTAGVTIMQMDVGLDTGDMISVKEIELAEDETGGSLFDKLAVLGGQLIVETLTDIEAGNINPVKQDNEASTYAKMLTKEFGHIDFSNSAESVERLVRGCNPWPGTYTYLNGKTLKIWKTTVDKTFSEDATEGSQNDGAFGKILKVDKNYFSVKCGQGVLQISEVQLEGKKRMSVHDFLLGYQLTTDMILG